MTKEVWKDIIGYEGLYQVSNKRRVKSLNYKQTKREGILSPRKDGGGYLWVNLYKNREVKHRKIHRLVAQAFIPNPDNLPEVNHKDETRNNNCVENLEWCDRYYNNNYRTKNRRKRETSGYAVKCLETGEIFASYREVEELTGIKHGNISACILGKQKTARKLHWEKITKGDKQHGNKTGSN